jgi:hypothetical protein
VRGRFTIDNRLAPGVPAEKTECGFARYFGGKSAWGMPAVNYCLMYREMVDKAKGDYNQVLYWSRRLDAKNQTLTPNPDVIYLMPFFNTQAAIEDVGPGGIDKGKGGKYAFLPPAYDKTTLPAGYIPMPSDTFRGYALLRSVLKSGSDEDVAKAVAYARRLELYPLSQAGNPPATTFVDASGVLFDSTIRYDVSFFESRLFSRTRRRRRSSTTRSWRRRPGSAPGTTSFASKCSRASMVRRSRCSTRRGNYRTSRESADTEGRRHLRLLHRDGQLLDLPRELVAALGVGARDGRVQIQADVGCLDSVDEWNRARDLTGADLLAVD